MVKPSVILKGSRQDSNLRLPRLDCQAEPLKQDTFSCGCGAGALPLDHWNQIPRPAPLLLPAGQGNPATSRLRNRAGQPK